jgi:hypothetical protein
MHRVWDFMVRFRTSMNKTIAINFMSFVKEPSNVALHKACMYTMCVVGKALGRGHYENKGRVCKAKLS